MTIISEQKLDPTEPVSGLSSRSPSDDLSIGSRLVEVAKALRREHSDPQRVLDTITTSAVANVPGAQYASITTVLQGKYVHSAALCGDVSGQCDKIQEQLGEGPCLESAIEQTTIRIDDMETETRWSQFSDAASALGVRSMICFQLYVEGVNFGALNLHATEPNAFDAEAESIGSLFAAHAAIAFSTAREEQQIRAALTSRDVIGQAKGMLMERYNLSSQAAFALLSKLSQDTNVKLVDLALKVVTDAEKTLE